MRTAYRIPAGLICSLAVLSLCLACAAKDDYVYPSVRKEMMTAVYDRQKGLSSVTLDDGHTYPVKSSSLTREVLRDSTARIVAHYLTECDGSGAEAIRLYSLRPVYFQAPVSRAQAQPLWGDEICLESAWKGLGYLNMTMLVPSSGLPHAIRFVEVSRERDADGILEVRVLLDHDALENLPGYTQTVYASLPVEAYLRDEPSVWIALTFSPSSEDAKRFLFTRYQER